MTQPAGLRPSPPCAIVIFGAAGDLTKRKLLPAIYNLKASGLLPRQLAVVGVTRKEKSHEQFREEQSKDIREFATRPVDETLWKEIRDALYYQAGEFTDPATYSKLGALLKDVARDHATEGNVLFYLATPPEFFGGIVKRLGEAGLTGQADEAWRRVVIEKPFGRDFDSARALNAELRAVLEESQIYRIDHYLGKETVQNIMVFRFANGLLEPVWDRRYVDHVQIMVAETVGVEDRGNYYEKAGVLRDMVQNHMFQLLNLVAMEPPTSFQADAVRDEKVKVLKAIRSMKPEVALQVENWRWAGVPFYLRSGMRLGRRDTEIMIQFRRPPLLLFDQREDQIDPNRLVLHIQPDEGIEIQMKAKHPGPTMELNTVKLEFSYKEFGETSAATGYERLLYDSMVGDSTLFHRADMVEEAWRIATPILDVWA